MTVNLSPLLPQQATAGSARQSTPSTTQVAEEFEALFLSHVLQVMRQSVTSGGLFEEAPGNDIYREMMDQEVARALAHQGGIGLAKQLNLQLKKSVEPSPTAPDPAVEAEPPTHGEQKQQTKSQPRITSDIGWRKDPFSGNWQYHQGVDLAAPDGTPVLAITAGRVVSSGWAGGYGNSVVVQNSDGVRVRYAHLSEIEVQSGQMVTEQQPVGAVGMTGRATGPHLHLEMEKDGHLMDPLDRSRPAMGDSPSERAKVHETQVDKKGERQDG
jgi:murein DD-endopeptidase MepM/ murein hydrolase activator NlpD